MDQDTFNTLVRRVAARWLRRANQLEVRAYGKLVGQAPDTHLGALWLGYLLGQDYDADAIQRMKATGHRKEEFFSAVYRGRPGGKPPVGTGYRHQGRWRTWNGQAWASGVAPDTAPQGHVFRRPDMGAPLHPGEIGYR